MENNGVHYFGPNPSPHVLMDVARIYTSPYPTGVDVETPSLTDRRLLGAGFTINPKEGVYFEADSPYFPWDLLANPSREVVFHNGGFDIQVLEKHHPNKVITAFHDSCLAAMMVGLPGKLADICLLLYGREPRLITDLIGVGKDQITMDQVPVKKVGERAVIDAQDCLEVWLDIEPLAPPRALNLDERTLPTAISIENRGIPINRTAVGEHFNALNSERTRLKTYCEVVLGFNPGSSLQLAAYLEGLGFLVPYKRGKSDGKMRPKLNKEMLETYYHTVPEAVVTLRYRSVGVLLTHLIRPLHEGKFLDASNRIHPRINLNVTDSGRISRSSPATQNIKSTLRNIVTAKEGYKILEWDFSQIELRTAAWMWNDKGMQETFRKEGGDVHQETADKMVNLGYGHLLGNTPAERRRTAKDLNFLVLYGGDKDTMWNRKQVPLEVGGPLVRGWFESYPGIANGIKEAKQFALANGYTETLYGRRRTEYDALNSGNEYRREAALRELINHIIQGTAAEFNKEALIYLHNQNQIHTVHDSGMQEELLDYTFPGIPGGIVPFDAPIELKEGPNWKDLVKVKL